MGRWHPPVLPPAWKPWLALATHMLAATIGGVVGWCAAALLAQVWP